MSIGERDWALGLGSRGLRIGGRSRDWQARKSQMRRLLMAIAALFLVFGCSGGQGPSKEDAIQQIGDRLYSAPSKYFAIRNLRYDSESARDADHYLVSVSYDLVFKMSMVDIKKDHENNNGTVIPDTDFVIAVLLVYKDANVGDSFRTHKQFLFARTDVGWSLEGEAK
jgi:hypothetical protein